MRELQILRAKILREELRGELMVILLGLRLLEEFSFSKLIGHWMLGKVAHHVE